MGIRLEFKRDPPGEPLDVILLVLICCYTIFSGILIGLMVRKSRVYIPLKTKNIPLLIAMNIFGVIHTWSAFISNEHISNFISLKQWNCVFWGFFVQYCVGLNGWFVALISRIYTYIYAYKYPDASWDTLQKHKVRLAIGITLPIFLMCVMIWAFGGSKPEQSGIGCTTSILWELPIALWIFICWIAMVYTFIYTSKLIHNPYLREVKEMRQISFAAIVAIAIGAPIVITHAIDTYAGRTIVTFMILLLHLFDSVRLVYSPLFKALKNDQEYARIFKTTLEKREKLVQVTNSDQLRSNELMWNDFLNYCSKIDTMRFTSRNDLYRSRSNKKMKGLLGGDSYTSMIREQHIFANLTSDMRQTKPIAAVNSIRLIDYRKFLLNSRLEEEEEEVVTVENETEDQLGMSIINLEIQNQPKRSSLLKGRNLLFESQWEDVIPRYCMNHEYGMDHIIYDSIADGSSNCYLGDLPKHICDPLREKLISDQEGCAFDIACFDDVSDWIIACLWDNFFITYARENEKDLLANVTRPVFYKEGLLAARLIPDSLEDQSTQN